MYVGSMHVLHGQDRQLTYGGQNRHLHDACGHTCNICKTGTVVCGVHVQQGQTRQCSDVV